jgi:Histidine kinase
MNSSQSTWLGNTVMRIFGWRRLRIVLITAAVIFVLFAYGWTISYWILIGRLVFSGLCALAVFGLFECWPPRLPNWLERWALQVAGVAVIMPIAVWIGYTITNLGLTEAWWRDKDRLVGFASFTFLGMLIGPWVAAAALFKQIRNEAQNQALAFALERSNFEKQALNASLRLLQAQVEPHFLFNTLANVRELVITGSPQAATVLDSLIAYLRAAVPRINAPMATITQELDLVRAYLEIMQVRMPDRLSFNIEARGDTAAFICPPLSLLTLVENAVRHGIDPTEDGGRIDISVVLHDGIWHAEVLDTGIGSDSKMTINQTTGTGLTNLRERLRLAFGDQATLTLSATQPHGTRALIRFPAISNSL